MHEISNSIDRSVHKERSIGVVLQTLRLALTMKAKSKNDPRNPLLPVRHSLPDFFLCDLLEVAPKGDLSSMEHPIFSLSTRPDLKIRRYENHENFIEIKPSAIGMATIFDRDILIYCISKLVSGMNKGIQPLPVVRFKAHDLLRATNRMTNGQAYESLRAALERLRGTTISTNIVTGDVEQLSVFGLIERAAVIRERRDGRMIDVEVKLSDWFFNAIRAKEVLTLHRDYFRLRKPLERRLYELARKHCGIQNEWRISLSSLRNKCGASTALKGFNRMIRNIVSDNKEKGHFPDYEINLDGDFVVFSNKKINSIPSKIKKKKSSSDELFLKEATYNKAKDILPRHDIYALEAEWKSWLEEQELIPKFPDKNFLNFCDFKSLCDN